MHYTYHTSGRRKPLSVTKLLTYVGLCKPHALRPFGRLEHFMTSIVLISIMALTYSIMKDGSHLIERVFVILVSLAYMFERLATEMDWKRTRIRRSIRHARKLKQNVEPSCNPIRPHPLDGVELSQKREIDADTSKIIKEILSTDLARSMRDLGMLPPIDEYNHTKAEDSGADENEQISFPPNNRLGSLSVARRRRTEQAAARQEEISS